MSELPKAYTAQDVEKKWYHFWKKNDFFTAQPDSPKPAYCIMIPPPNVTGVLHMGHALVNTLQDILIRFKRMSGYDTLWMPGTDHAGIATQTVVERHLLSTQGKRRSDFSRQEFLDIVWKWKEKSERDIIQQLEAIGASCDWSRLRFTMDPQYCRSVRFMFKKLFTSGLIYRDDYLVNWDPVTQTALADDEVEHEERTGFLWYFKYPLVGGSDSISFATTRPETMLGDTAIAVHPKDERYRHLIDKMVLQPLTGRHIPIIADEHVDPAFGTGAVKITPAHDHDDYLMGQRHALPMITIMTGAGRINENGAPFTGMTMQEARLVAISTMQAKGFFLKQEPHTNRVGVSYRSKAVIEPHLSKQWFVKMTAFKSTLKEIVKHGKTKLFPAHWDSTYFYWIDHLHDWCISRQLWWGHRIPIWYHRDDSSKMVCHDGEGEPEEVKKAPDLWIQDPDVLDTWFSSALWPFATLGWPDTTKELYKYYPNSTLVTGHDILFFWVARMLMMGNYAFGQVPFSETFLHGLIYGKSYWRNSSDGGIVYVQNEERKAFDRGEPIPKDVLSKWEKMSKSKGNIIDPQEVIAEFGADAMRMALASSTTEAPQIDLDLRRFEEFRNFANKVWNGARFVFMNLEIGSDQFATGLDPALLALEDHWILGRLHSVTKEVVSALNAYAFDKAATCAYEFYWNELCAYFLEISKPVLFGKKGGAAAKENKQKLLVILLLHAIRLMHPMAPFITEELFSQLKSRFPDTTKKERADPFTQEACTTLTSFACMVAPFPQPLAWEHQKDVLSDFQLLSDVVYTIRNIRGEMNLGPQIATDVFIIGKASDPMYCLIQENSSILSSLVKIKQLFFQQEAPKGPSSRACVGHLELFVSLPEEMIQQERQRLIKEEERLQKALSGADLKLANTNFLEKAPQNIIQQLIETKEITTKQLEAIRSQLNAYR